MEKPGCDVICRSHSARSEQFRVCPTKLTKRELEDLYYALIENNQELKKTLNGQQDRIKVLSTKMQKMSAAQKIFKADSRKDCCNASRVVNQQKEIITDLNRANERMSDRIRKLNMRLCSAKQFCKSVTPRCIRCHSATSPYLIKNSSYSQRDQSQSTLKLAISNHNLSRCTLIAKYTQTEENNETVKEKNSCDDNKCSSLMDELKHRIDSLQEDLSNTHKEYSSRGKLLQQELEQSRNDNLRVRSECVAIEEELQQKIQKNATLTAKLRTTEGQCNELRTQLSIQKMKLAEMEIRLKAATVSNQVTRNIEDTLTSIQEAHKSNKLDLTRTSPRYNIDSSAELTVTESTLTNIKAGDESKFSKSAEDSGYIDAKNNENILNDQALHNIIEDLTKRIIVLQTQVDVLTVSPPEYDGVQKYTTDNIDNNDKSILPIPSIVEDKSSVNDDEVKLSNPKALHDDDDDVNIKPSDPEKDTLKLPDSNKIGKWKRNTTKMRMIINKNKIRNDKSKVDEISNENCHNKDDDVCDDDNSVKKELNTVTTSGEKTYNIPEKEKNNNLDAKISPKLKAKNEKDVNPVLKRRILIKSKSVVEKPKGLKSKGKSERFTERMRSPKTTAQREIEYGTMDSKDEGTYTLEIDKNSHDSSPNDTGDEISSMTDLSEEKEYAGTLHSVLSPGERRYYSTQSESELFTTSTTNFTLSEGEIPDFTVKRKSYGDNLRTNEKVTNTAPKMEETLQAIGVELARCKRLLSSERSHEYRPT